uniref:efflux RND transporter periplasmic adaptor subunit n=1 Tax=Polynucleobacter sp. TaxID=2029855 RepID=UPI0040477EE2
MSKIELELDKAVTQVSKFKNWVLQLLCQLWKLVTAPLTRWSYPETKDFIKRFKWRIALVLLLIYAGTKAYDYFYPPASKTGAPQLITSFVTEKKDVPLIIDATGTIISNSIVDIRPMVTNKVEKIHVKDGQEVKAGELLFTLDNRTDTANYQKLKALADDAQQQYLRAKELVSKNFISRAGLETSAANAKSAQAAADAARVQLSFDFIRSPINGKAGIINVFPGTLVQASNTVISATNAASTSTTSSMVTITQLNPINVQFVIPEKDIPALLENKQSDAPMKVTVTVGRDGKNTYEGEVLVVDNQIDPQIAAVRVKAQIPNEKYELLPGQFARVSLKANTLKDVISIPSEAVVINPRGKLVYIVEKDNKVIAKPVVVTYEYQGISVVNGLEEGQRIVVEGKQNLRTGSKVREAKSTNAPVAK